MEDLERSLQKIDRIGCCTRIVGWLQSIEFEGDISARFQVWP